MNLTNTIAIPSLPVMEHFYTLQGEGFHQGRAAYFVRLGGCDVGCVWCDVKDSWDAAAHPKKTVEEIVSLVIENGASLKLGRKGGLVVITGGEPLMHDLTELTNSLKEKGFETNIETSGAHPLSGTWDWVCLSPKKFKAPLPEVVPFANELKVVIFNQSDFLWAEQFAAMVVPQCKLFLQPEWDRASIVTPLIIEYIKENPQWELSLQIHKYINVP
jgi:7-carboxy-7-deazaguanine synthase